MYRKNCLTSSVGSIYHSSLKKCWFQEKFPLNNVSYSRTKTRKTTMLEFNIGPSFLHMIFYNNFTGRSFSYLFDYSNCVCSDKVKQLNDLQANVNTNQDQGYTVKVNIFKEKCACDKCLSACWLLHGCQPVNLAHEFFQVLKSEHCSNWNRCWIEMVLEQMFIFFSCIKNGVIYERLLECACDCANMLVMKHLKTDLLEYKYSYAYFIKKLIDDIQLDDYKQNDVKIDQSIYCGREIGKVYFDLIESFAIVTFESEKEMNAYTNYENKLRKAKPEYLINLFRKSVQGSDDNYLEPSRSSRIKDRVVLVSDLATTESVDKTAAVFDDKSMETNSKYEAMFLNKGTMSTSSCIFDDSFSLEKTPNRELSKQEENFDNFLETDDSLATDDDQTGFFGNAIWSSNMIPVMHGCDKHLNKTINCSCKSLSLAMILNLGKGRALPKEAVENLELLENKEGTVTYRKATIAASALVIGERQTVRRIIVPVVLTHILNLAKHCKLENVSKRMIDDSNFMDKDVEQLINDLIDKICCLETVGSDSNDENSLKECLDDSHVEQQTVTKSIDHKVESRNVPIFSERSKREIKMSSRFINSVFFDEASLPFASSVFHGSRSLGTQRRMEFVSDERRKRRVKLMGDECLKRKIELASDVCKKRKMDLIIDAWKKRGSSTVLRKLDFSVGNIDEKKTLADILIWCAYHDKYNCPCILSVCRMKHNVVIWQPPKLLKYLTYKVMSKIEIRQKRSCEVYFFDSEQYSARTYGIPVNYTVRNNCQLFSAKRRYELENNVTTSTNSFIKLKYSVFKEVGRTETEEEDGVSEEEQQYDDVIRYECKENVYIVAAENQDDLEEIDIIDSNGGSDHFSDIIVISDNEEDASTSLVHLSDLDEHQTKLNRVMVGRKQLPRFVHSAYPKTYLKSSRKVSKEKPAVVDSGEQKTCNNNNSNLEVDLVRNSSLELNLAGANLLESELQVERNVAEIEVNVNSPLKQLKTYLFQQNSIDITNYDSSLENCLMRLKDHPLKDYIYCENKLPKLALYCVTPGIGYLPIVEYTPKALVVLDPIFPEVLHSFKNLSTANMWLNKFLKDFLVFESIDISLKWIIVKPGIIKMKQSQPFSPAIFENSPIIITKDGEIRFSRKEVIGNFESNRQEIADYKRKLTGDTVSVDINGSDGKRKKIHLDSLGPIGAKILTRTVNLVQQYPSRKSSKSLAAANSSNGIPASQLLHQNTINSELNHSSQLIKNIPALYSPNNKVSLLPKQLKISPTKHYQLIPANLLIQMNVAPANSNSLSYSKYGYISTGSTDRAPFIVSNNFNNNEIIITNENPSEILQ